MKFILKIVAFLAVFSLVFYFVRSTDFYQTLTILEDLGGVPWLYAAIVTLFSILVGFTLQKELENWNKLQDAINGEADSLRNVWLWSRHLSSEYKTKFDFAIKHYLEEMSGDGLYRNRRGERSMQIEEAFGAVREVMFSMSENDVRLMTTTFTFFSNLLEHRTHRLRYSYNHIPPILRRTLMFVAFLVISLCLLIGVQNVLLDYIFTTSIALIAYVIFLVIDDLDHPLTHGHWHITPVEYQLLLERIQKES